MKKKYMMQAGAGLAAVAVLLSGCSSSDNTSNTSTEAKATDTLNVTIVDDKDCKVSAATAQAGKITFKLKNDGKNKNEFEILSEDGKRIVSEKENIAAGQSAEFIVQLGAGKYYTVCKDDMVGPLVGKAEFTVTGDANVKTDETWQKAADEYAAFVKSEVDALLVGTKEFAEAYKSGDTQKAKSLFAPTRAHYEAIEPVAETLGDLDGMIDFRIDEVDEETGKISLPLSEEEADWTGWHAIELDLWGAEGDDKEDAAKAKVSFPYDDAKRATLAQKLVDDTQALADFVNGKDDKYGEFIISVPDISNGAIGLMDEVADSKITGEEDRYSHTDMSDFTANVAGAKKAYEVLKPALQAKENGKKLIEEIEASLATMEEDLAKYKEGDTYKAYSLQKGDAEYDKLAKDLQVLSANISDITKVLLGDDAIRPEEPEEEE
ncbi:MAG: cupredoxin domain-containing protein [Actinomycetaceae bacterium]|nr:cupredoxin domain-containing protein [Actinomycetaceae bacterium]